MGLNHVAYHGNKDCNKDWLDGYFQAKKDLEQQLLDATDFSEMKPEEVAKEKVRINKMSQVKLRLASLEAKNMKPKRV